VLERDPLQDVHAYESASMTVKHGIAHER